MDSVRTTGTIGNVILASTGFQSSNAIIVIVVDQQFYPIVVNIFLADVGATITTVKDDLSYAIDGFFCVNDPAYFVQFWYEIILVNFLIFFSIENKFYLNF